MYQTKRVILRRLTAADRDEFTWLVGISSELLQPWVRLPATPMKFAEYLERFSKGTEECLLICVRESGSIAGTATIGNIIRGPYQRATVGYNAFAPTVRQGLMSEGFSLVVRFAFEDLRLHRLEADIQPGNRPSLQFAEKMGFRREGYSPGFAYIDGSWRDHERWAINTTN